MRRNKHQCLTLKLVLLPSLVMSLGAISNALAEDKEGTANTEKVTKIEEATKVDEVIVTAQFRSENLQSVPIAMGAYDREFITDIGANSLTEMEYAIPSINFGSGGRDTRGEIAIRGIGGYSRNIGINARVAVYVDGALSGRSSSFDQSLLDAEQVEVLRGPQGTLSGTNALAGAINIVTQKPSEEFSAKLAGDLGNFDHKSITGKINVPLAADLYSSLLVNTTKRDGFIHNLTSDTYLQGEDRTSANLKFRYVGVDRLTLDLGIDYLKDDMASTNALALADGPGALNGLTKAPGIREVAHDTDEGEMRKLKGANFTAHYGTPDNYQWVSIISARGASFNELTEEDYSPLDVASSLFDESSDLLTQELRLISPRSEYTDFVLGIYLLDQNIETERSANSGKLFAVPNASVKTPAEADVTSYSAYANGNFRFLTDWEMTAGIRAVHETKDIVFSSLDTIGSFVKVNNLKEEQTYNELLPKVGINYHFNTEVLFYGSVSRGYTSGGWNADFLRSLENFSFNPEYAINYELGVKSSFLENRITLNSTAFVTKIRDFQVFQFIKTSTGGTIISLTNAGQVTSKGLELDISAALTSELTVSLNNAFTQATFDEFKNGGGLGVDYDQNDLPFAPARAHYLALDYKHEYNTQLSFYSHFDYRYTDNYFSNSDNSLTNSIPEHYVTNARLGIKINNDWDISIWAKNLTNQTNLRQRSESFLRVQRGYYDPPRFYGLSVNYSI
jgi:iron complex outermembrane recepter protein